MGLYRVVFTLSFNVLMFSSAFCQEPIISSAVESLTDKWIGKWRARLDDKIKGIEGLLEKQTTKCLDKLNRIERRMQRQLMKLDSLAALNLINLDSYYKTLSEAKDNINRGSRRLEGRYTPYLDSINCALSFLNQSPILKNSKQIQGKLSSTAKDLSNLVGKFNQADKIRSAIIARRALLQNTLSRYKDVPKSLQESALNYKKILFQYGRQIEQYKQLLTIPSSIEKNALRFLTKVTGFEEFFKNNSELSALFGNFFNNPAQASVAGLQTRLQIQNMITQQISTAGPNAMSMLQQNLQVAQAHLTSFKDKINQYGQGSADLDMPDFTPKEENKTSFWKRLEYGTNIQTVKANAFFPSTSDIALSIGYKINPKSVVGLGGSFKIGWGQDIRHIQLTAQGASLRSFLDFQLKGSFFASGGLEYNYQTTPTITTQSAIYNVDNWHSSGLVGVTKVISLKSKVFKKTRIQLLWDFLSYQQQPRTQAIKYRVQYNF